jgi:hypothetical protein
LRFRSLAAFAESDDSAVAAGVAAAQAANDSRPVRQGRAPPARFDDAEDTPWGAASEWGSQGRREAKRRSGPHSDRGDGDDDDADDDGDDIRAASAAPTGSSPRAAAAAGGGGGSGGGGSGAAKGKKPVQRRSRAAQGDIDLDVVCGVPRDDTPDRRLCGRSLGCKVHRLGDRRAVQGRSRDFDVLLAEHLAATGKTTSGGSKKKKKKKARSSGRLESGGSGSGGGSGGGGAGGTPHAHPRLAEASYHYQYQTLGTPSEGYGGHHVGSSEGYGGHHVGSAVGVFLESPLPSSTRGRTRSVSVEPEHVPVVVVQHRKPKRARMWSKDAHFSL